MIQSLHSLSDHFLRKPSKLTFSATCKIARTINLLLKLFARLMGSWSMLIPRKTLFFQVIGNGEPCTYPTWNRLSVFWSSSRKSSCRRSTSSWITACSSWLIVQNWSACRNWIPAWKSWRVCGYWDYRPHSWRLQILLSIAPQGGISKIISGDNPVTVSYIAQQAGFENWRDPHRLFKISDDQLVDQAEETYSLRQIPEKLLIQTLKAANDWSVTQWYGVTIFLLFREADCSIVMAEGDPRQTRSNCQYCSFWTLTLMTFQKFCCRGE